MIIEGAISVKAALESKHRTVDEVWMTRDENSNDKHYIEGLCQKQAIPCNFVSNEVIQAKATGKTHGGLPAFVQARTYQSLEGLKALNWIVLIEGIEDPFNLGYMIRTVYAAGAQAILLTQRDWSKAESTLLKSSAGCFDRLPIVLIEDASAIVSLKKQGFKLVIGQRSSNSVSYTDYAYPPKLILGIGGEMRGLSRGIKDLADAQVMILYPNQTKVALNAVSACAILSFEITRQRTR